MENVIITPHNSFVGDGNHQRINAYPHPKWIHLAVSEAKEVTEDNDKDDDEDPRKAKAQCYEEMRKAAAAEYEKGCDLPTITLKVDFIDCANTEEYKQYRALTEIFWEMRCGALHPASVLRSLCA